MTRLSADERRVLVGRLLDQRRTAGLPAEEVSGAAKQVGIAERTLWRWLAGGLPGARQRSQYHLTEADRDAYAAARGNVAAAWRAQHQANEPVPSLRTFQMAITRELLPIERAATTDGIEGQRRHTVYLRWEARHRNARWEADHVELPVLVLPPRATRPCRPWATRSSSIPTHGCWWVGHWHFRPARRRSWPGCAWDSSSTPSASTASASAAFTSSPQS